MMQNKHLQKVLSLLVAMVMLLAMFPLSAITVSAATTAEFAGGSGTEAEPYLIETKEHLNNVRKYLDAHYKMVADIVFTDADFVEDSEFYNSGAGWIPIGASSEAPFTGTFDGNNFSVSGLSINIASTTDIVVGLFGYSSANIRNLSVQQSNYSVTINGSNGNRSYTGGLVGYQTNGEIINCSFAGSISSTTESERCYPYAAGIVGYVDSSNISCCKNNGQISVLGIDSSYSGGICAYSKSESIIASCFNNGEITGGMYSGGIVGSVYVGLSSQTQQITNCSNSGIVTGTYNSGGICGYLCYYCTISNCYNTGSILAASPVTANSSLAYSYAGGITGDGSRGEIINCYNAGSIKATVVGTYPAYAGGISGKTSCVISTCYNIGTIVSDDYRAGICGNIDPMNGGSLVNCYYLDTCLQGVYGVADTTTKCTKDQLLVSETYLGFDFDNIWKIGVSSSYNFPELALNAHTGGNEWTTDTTNFAGGNGSMYDPYQIATKQHLDNIRDYSSDGNWFVLIADISFSSADFAEDGDFYNNGQGWLPIGSSKSDAFVGVFDGNNHTISGLTVTLESNVDAYLGLFGYCQGTVRNLNISDVLISATATGETNAVYAGGICGYLSAGVIENCSVSGTILAQEVGIARIDQSDAYAGGIAGAAIYSSIVRCKNFANVSAFANSETTTGGSYGCYAYAGGLTTSATGTTISHSYNVGKIVANVSSGHQPATRAGGLVTGSNSNISFCYNTGDVQALGNPNNIAGGIVASYSSGTISNCYNTGSISSGGDVGGAIGYFSSGTITSFYNTGNLEKGDSSSSRLGGVVGYASDGTVNNCYFLDTAPKGIGKGSGTTIALSLSDMTLTASFIGFDFNDIWTMSGNVDYPYPELIESEHQLTLKSIEIQSLPSKTEYLERIDELDISNGYILLTYDVGITKSVPITKEMVSGFDNTKVGAQQLTVTYEGKTCTYEITVIAVDYTITFRNWDDSVISSDIYHWGDKVTIPSNPTKPADNTYTYTFAGWDKDVVDCAGNATYTATYTPNYIDYTVTFKNWDGSVISTNTYHYGDIVTAPTAPTRPTNSTYTYEFAGWDNPVVNCNGDTVYIATYTPNYIRYTVVFQNYDGTVLSKQFCHYGDAISVPSNPSKPSDKTYTYSFAGWDSAVTNCYGNKVYTATYTASYIDYIITFRNWDGSIISEHAYHYGDTVTLPAAPVRPNTHAYTYTFQGWNKTVTLCLESTTYTAVFTSAYIDYTVVFKSYDGTVISSAVYHYGDFVVAPTPSDKPADNTYTYTFAGWDSPVVPCNGDKVYTATYTPAYIDYTVVFENWNGDVLSSKTYHWGDPVTAPADPTKDADNTYTYSFAGWDKEIVDCAGNATYTATYTPTFIDYAVVFKNWDGIVLSESTYHYGDSVVTPATPSRNADRVYTYEFAGWDKEVTSVSGDVTYTATYTAHLRKHVVSAEINSKQVGYPTLVDAVSDAPSGSTLQLISDVEEDVIISKNLVLDLNGFDITGNITVTSGATLSVKDSQTDDYTIEDDFGYGKIVGTINGIQAEDGYLMISEADGISFHRLNLDIATISFRPSVAGIYYQCHFGGDEVIKRNITSYGIAMGADMMPGFAENTYTRFDATTWNVGTDENGDANNLKNGSLLYGIMKTDHSNAENSNRAEMQIYGQAYIELTDGTRILGDPVHYSLREIVEGTDNIDGVDGMWNTLTDVQKEEVLAFYNAFKPVVEYWTIPNIKSALES